MWMRDEARRQGTGKGSASASNVFAGAASFFSFSFFLVLG